MSEIYAIDFDGTLCEYAWPSIGRPNKKLIRFLIQKQKEGAKLILWTCRCNEMLQKAVDWSTEQGLIYDAVNDNIPESIEKWGVNSRKVSADYYIDDKVIDPMLNLPFHPEGED